MSRFTTDDVYLITGASSGIGRATALLFNEQGATVLACGRDCGRLESLAATASRPDGLHLEPKELLDDLDSLPAWIMALKEKYGRLKGLVNCAGVSETLPFQAADLEKGRRIFDLNYFVPLFLARGLADRRVNAGPGSSLTFLASIAGVSPEKGKAVYGGSKAALIQTARIMAQELAPRGIRVNCLSPARIMTPMTEASFKDAADVAAQYPLGLGRVDDAASLAAFLAGDEARWITGQNYILDGGYRPA